VIAVGEDTRAAVSLFSKYCSRPVVYPSPKKRPRECHEFLLEFLEESRTDVFFPMDDPVCDIVAADYAAYTSRVTVVFPPPQLYAVARDKLLTARFASQKGVRSAVTLFPDGPAAALQAARDLGFPCVLKPRKSSGSRGLKIVRQEQDFGPLYEQVSAGYGPPLVQEFIHAGPKLDVCLLYDSHSALKASFVQREIRGYPVDNGPSTLQESVLRPDLVNLSARLLEGTGWKGIAEIEYMLDPRDETPVLLEINPRFWASVKCAMLAGVDFATLALKGALGLEVPEVHSYALGVRCRWLLPGDVLHFLSNPRRWEMDPPFFHVDSRTRFDIIEMDDPGPVLGFTAAVMRYLFDPEMWRFVIRRS
jgi:biotin carboxylase